MEIFSGFEYANSESGYTQIGNKNFALLAQIDNLSEMKVTLYLMRNTWGYQEYDHEKLITTEEFVNGRKRKDETRIDGGCGLKTTAVKEGLARAITHGYILCTVDNSDKGRIKKYYRLRMDEANKQNATDELDSRVTTMHSHIATVDGRVTTPDSRKATSRGPQYDHRSEKETLETNSKKNTLKKEEESTSSSVHPIWKIWCQSRNPGKETIITPLSTKNLAHCQNLVIICQQEKKELTIELIQAVEKWSCEEHGYTKYWLGNLVNDLSEYLREQNEVPQPEMPELTAEESEQEVLWTSRPSTVEQLFAQDASMDLHMGTLKNNLRMMSRGEAREYNYDMPVQHYTPEQVQWYKQRTETRELAIAG